MQYNGTLVSPGLVEALNSAETEAQARNRLRVVPKFAQGLSDSQRDLEWAVQKRLYAAIREMEAAMDQVNLNSTLYAINTTAWDEFVHDEIPDSDGWNEKISVARRG